MDGSVTLITEHHSYELPISAQLGDSYNDNAYLIIVTGTMGGARVKIFCQV